MAKPVTSLVGLYIFGEDMHGWLDTIADLAANGTPLPFALVMRQGNPKEITPSQIKARSPKTIVGERWYWEPPGVDWSKPDLYQVGVDHFKLYMSKFPIDRAADFQMTINEPMPGPGTASFFRGEMDEAHRQNVHVFVGNFPETWPALPNDLDEHGQPKYFRQFWTLPEVHAMVAQVKAQGHALSWHTYIIPDPTGAWDHGYSMGREDEIITCLPANLRDVLIYLTEWGTGWSQWFNSDVLINGIHKGDTWLHTTKANVGGAAPWVAANWIDNAHPQASSDLAFHKAKLVPYWKTARF